MPQQSSSKRKPRHSNKWEPASRSRDESGSAKRGPAKSGSGKRGGGDRRTVMAAITFPLGIFLGFLAITFLIGGGARADISSLMVLRPLAVLALAAGMITLSRQHLRDYRFLFLLAGACVLLVAAHVVPLPPALWQALPGREILLEIDQMAGFEGQWRSLSLDPVGTWNALWSLSVPLAALALAAQIDDDGHEMVLHAIIIAGLVSVVIAILQAIGDPRGPLYFYRITNNGSLVGLFSNRNHQAVFLATLIPVLAVWSNLRPNAKPTAILGLAPRSILAFLIVLVIVPLILVTGSRAGLLAMLAGFVLAGWCRGVFDRKNKAKTKGKTGTRGKRKTLRTILLLGLPLAAMGFATLLLGRGLALMRFGGDGALADTRSKLVPILSDISWDYAPWGTGVGSFEAVFKMHEPIEFLGPVYVNHAHNDYLELLMTSGAAGALLVIVAAIGAFFGLRRILRTSAEEGQKLALARLGFATLLLLAIASLVDYPLRVPSIQLLAILMAVWFAKGVSRVASGSQ